MLFFQEALFLRSAVDSERPGCGPTILVNVDWRPILPIPQGPGRGPVEPRGHGLLGGGEIEEAKHQFFFWN